MANAWSELQWGIGGWGLQNDVDISLTGIVSSISVNSITYVGEPGGWGQLTWGFGEWGDQINPNVDVTGLQLNTSTGNEEAFTDININLSTNLITSTTNTLTITGGTLVEPTFVLANTSVASVFGGENVIIEVTTPGTATTWGVNSWGSGAWNQIAGVEAQIGNETIEATAGAILSGVQSNTTTGTFTITGDSILNLSTIAVTGVQISSQTGRLFITAWEVVDIGVTNNWSVVDIAA